ncbi:BadF/BadG/BcrA/BcrD ATPase family protein [Flavobacterium sp. W21_SRS_FM6]|uniref:BadF/BadG/BcrA/BcrD ATPase family protein n=1 Tax=Flavobacterium sp. W21_SRS_FM6 TaxID=3240268 RepID=UPI003F8E5CF2
MQPHYFIGIDGGGTKCKALLQNSSGDIIGQGLAGSANPATHYGLAIESITQACERAVLDAQLSASALRYCHVAMGLAGVSLPSVKDKMLLWQHPFATIKITSDLHIACLGAHNSEEGAVIICGTGSSAFMVHQGKHVQLGGHGFTTGDKGGGAWIGVSATRLCLEAMDGLSESSPLVDDLKQQLGCQTSSAVVEQVNGAPAVFFAGLAPLVIAALEQHDAIAVRVIQEGADYVSRLARRLLSEGAKKVALIGGLAPHISPWLANDVQRCLVQPLYEPAFGALILAKKR